VKSLLELLANEGKPERFFSAINLKYEDGARTDRAATRAHFLRADVRVTWRRCSRRMFTPSVMFASPLPPPRLDQLEASRE
jgi:hypothetical protein